MEKKLMRTTGRGLWVLLAIAAMLCPVVLTSCSDSDDDSATFKVNGKSYTIRSAAYYYRAGSGYNIVFSDVEQTMTAGVQPKGNLLTIDIPESRMGEDLYLGGYLDDNSWSFYVTTNGRRVSANPASLPRFTDGAIKVELRGSGTIAAAITGGRDSNGGRYELSFEGSVSRVADYIWSYGSGNISPHPIN